MPDKRFIIHLGGAPRSLFSVVERGDETQLGLKSPFTIGRRGSAPLDMEPYDPSMIAEQRFSIHASLCSEKGVSAIKQTTRLHNGEKICRRHYTKSIKSGENFAFIYFRRCGSLDKPEFVARGPKHHLSLGTFDSENFTLIYSVIVAAKDNEFKPKEIPPTINMYQHVFNNVRIIVLWTFLSIPSIPEFFTGYVSTDPGNPESWVGESADKCVQNFIEHAISAKYEMLLVIPAGLILDLVINGDVSKFFKSGFTDTSEYQNHRFCVIHRPHYLVRHVWGPRHEQRNRSG